MPFWIIDLDGNGKPTVFGPEWSPDVAEAFKEKNGSCLARVEGTEARGKRLAKKELHIY